MEERSRDLPAEIKLKNPNRRRFFSYWRIPPKTLARRLKALVAREWVIRRVLPEHGHHVEYSLNRDKAEEILEALPIPTLELATKDKIVNTAWVAVPLKREFPALRDLSTDEVIRVYLRLRGGDSVCPGCLKKGEGKKALDVFKDPSGKFYCRNCGEEISPDECNELINEIMENAFKRDRHKAFRKIMRFLEEIDKQPKNGKMT